MPSGMLPRVSLVSTNFSEESIASIIRVTRMGELVTTLAVTSNRPTLCVRFQNVEDIGVILDFNTI
jgi:hypothetical protein